MNDEDEIKRCLLINRQKSELCDTIPRQTKSYHETPKMTHPSENHSKFIKQITKTHLSNYVHGGLCSSPNKE